MELLVSILAAIQSRFRSLGEQSAALVELLEDIVWGWGVPVDGETIPVIVIALLGTGVFLTLRLAFIQVRRLGHGFAVTSGIYDDPLEPGDVPHFQALTTALSATVGIGNIAGVALAIHVGGPGALFWMWVTAFLGMAVKFSEVTLAQHFRQIHGEGEDAHGWRGSVSGGPMFYMERGLGKNWKPMAVFFAAALMVTSFFTGNAVQANTVADTVRDEFGLATWITGLVTATLVALVILGGIRRIGRVTAILAPVMAVVYVLGALTILAIHYDQVLPGFALIFREAFQPTAGIAGTGAGVFLMTMMWGVRRGLFSNEAGQGSAPIAHAAAKTDEPVSEGAVALLEPFIDTIVICTMTGLAIIVTGAWVARVPTAIDLQAAEVVYLERVAPDTWERADPPPEIEVQRGEALGRIGLGWNRVEVDRFYLDPEQTAPFTGTVLPRERVAVDEDGNHHRTLYGGAVRAGAPLTKLAFERGLPGRWGGYIVVLSVLLFAVSTAISWSYYGDRCAFYLWGPKAILPFKLVFVAMHFTGALVALATIWTLGDIALGIVTFPNLVALVLLSGLVVRLTRSYFERRPWEENYRIHQEMVQERKRQRGS
jgi:alanine or glycine:cation symporter, AGCS family